MGRDRMGEERGGGGGGGVCWFARIRWLKVCLSKYCEWNFNLALNFDECKVGWDKSLRITALGGGRGGVEARA